MITIDGGAKSGSGTIVRYSVALASLLGKEIKIENVRARRDKPGLRAQHLKVIQACQEMCRGVAENAVVGSKEITCAPRETFKGGGISPEYRHSRLNHCDSSNSFAFSLLCGKTFQIQARRRTISGFCSFCLS